MFTAEHFLARGNHTYKTTQQPWNVSWNNQEFYIAVSKDELRGMQEISLEEKEEFGGPYVLNNRV